MTRLVIFNDPHYSMHPPACRQASYPQEILAKMHDAARIARKLRADAIGCTGDWFHRKGSVRIREVNDVLAVLAGWVESGLEVFGIVGNHDIAGHALELEARAVGSLVAADALHLLDREPWPRGPVGDFYVTGTSYFHGCDDNDEARIKMYGAVRPEGLHADVFHVHLSHGTLTQNATFPAALTDPSELIDLLFQAHYLPDVIVCGHLHFSEGIMEFERPDDSNRSVYVCRVGSLARTDKTDLDRQPQVLALVAKQGEIKLRALGLEAPEIELLEVEEPSEPRCDPEEHVRRVQEFVRVLRSQSEQWKLVDTTELLTALGDKLVISEPGLTRALAAVQKRERA